MRYFAILVLLACLTIVGKAQQQATDRLPPFREGFEYKYEWESSVEVESALFAGLQAGSTRFRGQLYVNAVKISSEESGNWRALLRLRNVSVAIQNGDVISNKDIKWIEMEQLNTHLGKPFQLLYSGSKVEAAFFDTSNPKEPIWSTNFKRSLAALLQVEVRQDQQIYTERELSLHGKCKVHYYVTESREEGAAYAVEKEHDVTSCQKETEGKGSGLWRTFIHSQKCGNSPDQKISGVTSWSRYLVSAPNQRHLELLHIESSGSIWLDPFGIVQSSMKSKTKWTMHLDKTRRSSEPVVPALKASAFQDSLKFIFGYEEPSDLKSAQNLMLTPEPIIHSQEMLRRKSQLDLLNAVENMGITDSDQRINLDQTPLSAISYQLGSLDYVNLRALYRDLTVTQNDKLHTAKHLFLDLLLHSGSNSGIILLRDLLRGEAGQLDEMTAARLIAYAGAYVKQPSEKLLLEVIGLLSGGTDTVKLSGGEPLGIYRNAVVLAIASLIGKTCGTAVQQGFSSPPGCRIVRIEEYQKKFLDKVTSATLSFAERALHLHALHNSGYDSVLDSVLQLAGRKVAMDEESSNDLRIYLIGGLKAYQSQAKVRDFLERLLRDSKDSFRVRIAAAQILLDSMTISNDWQSIMDLMRRLLANESRTNTQVRHYLVTAFRTFSKSHNPCIRYLKEAAQQVLNNIGPFEELPTASSEYAFDFYDSSSSFGSQLILKSTASEFDDLPGFVSGKVLYFLKDSTAIQPYSFTMRMTGIRRQLSNLFSRSLKQEDLNLGRFHEAMEDFNFARRKELNSSADIAFALHGTTVMFYHFDRPFFDKNLYSIRNLDILHDMATNIQRYATAGALLYTQPNGLGFPTSLVLSSPILISLKGSISKTKGHPAGVIGRNITFILSGEIYGDHGIMSHLPFANYTQGVIRNRKAIFNVPISLELAADLKKMQFDITFVNPKMNNPLEISSLARTVLTLRPNSEAAADFIFKRACPTCRPSIIARRKKRSFSTALKTDTIANLTWPVAGMEAHAQLFQCDTDGSVGRSLEPVFRGLYPANMNHRGSLTGWAYLSFIRLQHHTFIQPEGRYCGYRSRVFRSAHLPVKEMMFRITLKINVNEEPEVAWQNGKLGLKTEIYWRGETAAYDRKGELHINYEYKNGGARNILSVRALVLRSPLINTQRDVVICLKAESTFQAAPADPIDISSYTAPPTAQGSIEFVMGDASSINQCPTDQFRFKMGLKASAGPWVMERKTGVSDDRPAYYTECEMEASKNGSDGGVWAAGLVPQTDSCYRTALDFTSLSNYQFDFRYAAVPLPIENVFEKLGDLVGLSLLPYWFAQSTTGQQTGTTTSGAQKEVGHLQTNVTFLPSRSADEFDEGIQRSFVNLEWSLNSSPVEKYERVALPPFLRIPLPSTSISQTARVAYETDIIPSCLITSQYVLTLDKVQLPTTFTPCYTLVSSDCGSAPLYAVLVRRITGGIHKMAVKVQVGGNTIEILPDESGRRKQLTVRANDLDVDVQNTSFSLPEGREKSFVLKVRYQSPIYIISSPGAGLVVHYSGSHVSVFPSWFYKNQHCGLCGNFDADGDRDTEWSSANGCRIPRVGIQASATAQLMASYTLGGRTCYPDKVVANCDI